MKGGEIMSIKWYDDGCGCRPTVKITDTGSMSTYQKLCYVIEKIVEVIEFVNNFQEELDKKEDSTNITNNRKLSETGDFTGTWFGETKSSVDSRINDCKLLAQSIIDWINTTPELSIEVIDGGFYSDGLTPEIIEAGNYTDPVTEEIDAGLYIYPCNCKII